MSVPRRWGLPSLVVGVGSLLLGPLAVIAQEIEIDRPGPPAMDSLEIDGNGDGVPDGWYNLRDASWVVGGVGRSGSRCLRFENARPGRPARASRAFGLDGRKTGAIVIGLWIRAESIGPGQRLGDDPGLVIDLLGDGLRAVRRGSLGPWTKGIGTTWTHVAKRIAVPPATRDAILSVGLIGATGVLEVDDLSIDLIPVDATPSTQFIPNGDFELGDPAPTSWIVENGARRVFPGHESISAVELTRAGSRLLAPIGPSIAGLASIRIAVSARARDLRGADATAGGVYFLDDDAKSLSGPGGSRPLFRWSGSSDWSTETATVSVPPGATRAVLQFEKTNGTGSLLLDDVVVTGEPRPSAAGDALYHIADDTKSWHPVAPSDEIAFDSPLDASRLLDAPAGKRGRVVVKGARLAFVDGTRARFFGVQILPPVPFLDPERSEALADRLARSGVNLVRLGDLDSALGPARSLYDDTRDDTAEFDPVSLARFDHLVAALKQRGIYLALELQSARRFRPGDDVPSVSRLPLGGGPAAIFDAKLRAASLKSAIALLTHVNPETGLALKDEPALAWLTLYGEVSLFDLIDDPELLPPDLAAGLKSKGQGRPGWRTVESAALKEIADSLRAIGVQSPIAGVSHWRREPEFSQSAAATGLDLVDDRIYWGSSPFNAPSHRSILWSRDGGLLASSSKKQKLDRPYVLGQWCDQTFGAWAIPYEGPDLMIASVTALSDDWDAIVRRGIFVNPARWGFAAPGTSGGEDLYAVPEVLNANPAAYALLPHAASVFLRPEKGEGEAVATRRAGVHAISGWDPRRGRVAIETAHTVAIAGWGGRDGAKGQGISVSSETEGSVVAATSLGTEPIVSSRRLLVTAVARVEPTGFAWVDASRREVADPGLPPLLAEPVKGEVIWRRPGTIRAYSLDAQGRRLASVPVVKTPDGAILKIDGHLPAMHWEMTID